MFSLSGDVDPSCARTKTWNSHKCYIKILITNTLWCMFQFRSTELSYLTWCQDFVSRKVSPYWYTYLNALVIDLIWWQDFLSRKYAVNILVAKLWVTLYIRGFFPKSTTAYLERSDCSTVSVNKLFETRYCCAYIRQQPNNYTDTFWLFSDPVIHQGWRTLELTRQEVGLKWKRINLQLWHPSLS